MSTGSMAGGIIAPAERKLRRFRLQLFATNLGIPCEGVVGGGAAAPNLHSVSSACSFCTVFQLRAVTGAENCFQNDRGTRVARLPFGIHW